MFWRKKRAALPPLVGCFGKLPATGDFIRHNAGGDELAAYDRWLGSAIDLARRQMGHEFDGVYAKSVGLFVFRPEPKGEEEPQRAMVGAWAASGDNAGRLYPMTVFGSYDYQQLVALGGALPIALWPLLTSVYELATNGRGLPVDAFLERVARIQPPSIEDPDQASAAFRDWLQSQRMKALWDTGFGTEASRFWVLHNVLASVEPFRGQEFPRTGLCVRLPLGAGDAFALAVWLDATLRLARSHQKALLNVLWVPQRTALVHLGSPHVGSFREIIAPTAQAEHVADLCGPPTTDDAAAKRGLGPQLEGLVERTDISIATFLERLGA